MWRLWTRGWGVSGWWCWFKNDGLPWWIARRIPRHIALLTFVRVCAASGDDPGSISYVSAYKAWEQGAGK